MEKRAQLPPDATRRILPNILGYNFDRRAEFMTKLRVAPVLVALLLAGCSAFEPSARHPQAASAPIVPPPPPKPIEKQASLPPIPVPPPRMHHGTAVDPEKLVGLTKDETEKLIGAPATVRDEPPATVWSYGSTKCGIDIFFYLDLASQTFKALAYELKPKGPHGLQGGACIASLQTQSP